MDYCMACRRHLNGALCCPGCGSSGAPAGPAIPVPAQVPAPAAAPAYAGQQPYGQPAHGQPGQAELTDGQSIPEAGLPVVEEPRVPPQRSRAVAAPARGRRKARGRQRGVVVLSVAGLVVGGIGAMAMAVMGGPEGAVAPTGSTDPGHSASIGDAASDEASVHTTTPPVSPTGTHRSSKPSAPASSASPSASTGPTTAPATKPAASPTATPSATGPSAPATTGPATPTRSASPSSTCKPVLFWCA